MCLKVTNKSLCCLIYHPLTAFGYYHYYCWWLYCCHLLLILTLKVRQVKQDEIFNMQVKTFLKWIPGLEILSNINFFYFIFWSLGLWNHYQILWKYLYNLLPLKLVIVPSNHYNIVIIWIVGDLINDWDFSLLPILTVK